MKLSNFSAITLLFVSYQLHAMENENRHEIKATKSEDNLSITTSGRPKVAQMRTPSGRDVSIEQSLTPPVKGRSKSLSSTVKNVTVNSSNELLPSEKQPLRFVHSKSLENVQKDVERASELFVFLVSQSEIPDHSDEIS